MNMSGFRLNFGNFNMHKNNASAQPKVFAHSPSPEAIADRSSALGKKFCEC